MQVHRFGGAKPDRYDRYAAGMP